MVLIPQRDQNWTLLGMQLMADHCVDTVLKHSSLRCPSFDSSKAPPEQLQAHRRQLLAYHDQGDLRPQRTFATFFVRDAFLVAFGQPDFITLMHTIS